MSYYARILRWVEDMPDPDHVTALLADQAHLSSDMLGQALVNDFEKQFSMLFMPPNFLVRACSSGTAALQLALASLGLRPSSKVLVPAYAPVSVPIAIIREGFEPVFIDVDEFKWVITPSQAMSVLENHAIKAVVPVGTHGIPVNSQEWSDFHDLTGMPVVVAASQSIDRCQPTAGLTMVYDLNGSQGPMFGVGGMIACESAVQASCIDSAMRWGVHEGKAISVGNDWVMSPCHAAVGLAQLARMSEVLALRRRVFHGLAERLSNLGQSIYWKPSSVESMGIIQVSSPSLFNSIRLALEDVCVDVSQPLATALPGMPAFASFTVVGELSSSCHLVKSLLALPMHHQLKDWELDRIQMAIVNGLMKRQEPSVSLSELA